MIFKNYVKIMRIQPSWFPAETDVLVMLLIHLVSFRLCLHLDSYVKIYSNVKPKE